MTIVVPKINFIALLDDTISLLDSIIYADVFRPQDEDQISELALRHRVALRELKAVDNPLATPHNGPHATHNPT